MNLKLFEKKIIIPFHKECSNDEMEKIKLGFKPISMEQRWGFEFCNDCLYCYRSWTKNCIFIANFESNKIVSIAICRDETIYSSDNIDEDIIIFEIILENYLCG